MGFTRDGTHKYIFFPSRTHPGELSWLPRDNGASYFDYVIGDKSIFTTSDERFYSEKLARVPHSYQPNDRKRQISDAKIFAKQFRFT